MTHGPSNGAQQPAPGSAGSPTHEPQDTPAPLDSAGLQATALRERLRLSIERARNTQRTTPLGWAVACWFAWGRVPINALVTWLGVFTLALALILWLLRRVAARHEDFAWAYPRYLSALILDGLCWGSMCPLVMGYDPTLDTWLVTVLCGVAAVNAPVHILFRRAYRAQLLAMWIPAAGHAIHRIHQPNMPEMALGISVFFVMLGIYMGQLGERIQDNILLGLQKDVLSRQLRQSLAQAAMQAHTDPLTGRPNRRALDEELQRQHARFEHTQASYAVLLLDIDHFKQVNDLHGHGVGDETLRAFARRVAAALRAGDFLGRYGGEEFVVVLPGATAEQAAAVAQRVCVAVAAQALLSEPSLSTTVSIGVATSRPGRSAIEVVEAADRAVYQAKRLGRNRVCIEDGATRHAPAPS